MSQRFFIDNPITSDRTELVDAEAHHLLHVMRAGVGDEVVLFDGSGAEFSARVVQLKRSSALLEICERREVDRELPFDLVLGVALPKGDRQKWLIEKTTELGVRRIVPLSTRRGVAQPEPTAIERLRKSVVEASKQCGRNRLMEIEMATSFNEFIERSPAAAQRWIAHPVPTSLPTNNADTNANSNHFVAIGPEGGFTDEECVLACSRGWQPLSLGQRILRVETAAIAIAAMLTITRPTIHTSK